MDYRFYGWEQANVTPINNMYKGIQSPIDLYDALSDIWCANTCAPRMRQDWSKDNKTLGQCSITAFLAQDIFGGKVYGIERLGGNFHCYNVIGDCVFDLTSEQFGDEVLCYVSNPEQFREIHFSKEEKRLRYEYLKDELLKKQNFSAKDLPDNNHKKEECFDVCDDSGIPTGDIVTRTVAHRDGIRHRTSHVWIIREVENRVQVLLQQRSYEKDSFPGCLDTSSAGHIPAGFEPLESALRELQEELGIVATSEELEYAGRFHIKYEKEFHDFLFKDNEVSNVYIYRKPVDISQMKIQKEELECVGWYDFFETYENIKNHNPEYCVPIEGFRVLGRKLGLLS